MKYLGIEVRRPRVAVFDFTGCEGCELQLANKEQSLVDFLDAIDVVCFREVSSIDADVYDIALVEGSISRNDEVVRLERIRNRADILVALGSCACFGGVNRLKNAYDLDEINREVYGNLPKETLPIRGIKEVVPVDLEIPGCPVSKVEVERIVQRIVLDSPISFPAYPVCLECRQRYTTCMFQKGELCLGPITRGGCGAPCLAGGLGCWGCRGPATNANYKGYFAAVKERGFDDREVNERLSMFGGFEGVR